MTQRATTGAPTPTQTLLPTGTLMPESEHPMVRLMSEHLAALDSIRAAFSELAGATVPLQGRDRTGV